jgi:hypothetical protein
LRELSSLDLSIVEGSEFSSAEGALFDVGSATASIKRITTKTINSKSFEVAKGT